MVGTQMSIRVKCNIAKTFEKSNNQRGEATSCWKNEDMVGLTTQYQRAAGARRQYKPMAWRSIGSGVVNQTTQ